MKSYVVMVGSGKRRVIGRIGIISLSDARTEGKRIRAEMTLGVEVQPSKTFGEVLARISHAIFA